MSAASTLYPGLPSGSDTSIASTESSPAPEPAKPAAVDTPPADAPQGNDDQGGESGAPQGASEQPPAEAAEPILDERRDWFAESRLMEPPAAGIADYESSLGMAMPTDAGELNRAEFESSMTAAQKMGVGITTMQGLWAAGMETMRSPVKTNFEGAMSALRESWGDKTDARVAEANAYIEEASQHWPGLKPWLLESGLGNDPGFIRKVADMARQRNQ